MTRASASHRPQPTSVPAALAIAKAAGLTQADLGKAVGASERTVQSWTAPEGSRPTGAKLQRLLDVSIIVNLLGDVYTDEGVKIWLHSRNRNLDLRRPIDLLGEGEHDKVLDEVLSLVHSS